MADGTISDAKSLAAHTLLRLAESQLPGVATVVR